MRTVHHRRFLIHRLFQFFDPYGITNEVDKSLLKESVKVTAEKALPTQRSENLVAGSPRQVLKTVKAACADCPEAAGTGG
jgi:hypothetical protein